MKKLRLNALAVTAALLCAAGSASAATIAIQSGTAGTGGGATSPTPLVVNFTGDLDGDGTAEAGETVGYQVRIAYDTTQLDATVAASGGATCSNDDAGGSILILNNSTTADALATGAQCSVTFTVAAGQTAGTVYTLNVNTDGVGDGCFDVNLAPTTCNLTDGSITIQAGPQAPTLTFTPPAPGPIVLNAAGAGSIAVSAGAGTAGTSTSLTCSSTNGTATVTGSPFAPDSTGSVAVQCNPVVGAVGTPFQVTCDPTQSAGTDQPAQVFDATCPPITPQPEFSAALSASLVGAPGATLTGSIGISNTGNAPLTITCGAPTGGFTVTSAPASPVAAGGSTSIGISCVAPAAAGATTTGSLVCTTNDTDETTVTFALSCTSQVLSVPSLGNTAKGLMIALLAGLGLLGFAMRRRVV